MGLFPEPLEAESSAPVVKDKRQAQPGRTVYWRQLSWEAAGLEPEFKL